MTTNTMVPTDDAQLLSQKPPVRRAIGRYMATTCGLGVIGVLAWAGGSWVDSFVYRACAAITLLLLVLWALKLLALVTTLRWLNSANLRQRLRDAKGRQDMPATLLSEAGGDVAWPFGVVDIRLKRCAANHETPKWRRAAARFLDEWLFRGTHLTVLVGLSVVFVTAILGDNLGGVVCGLYAIAFASLISIVLLAWCTIVSVQQFGTYIDAFLAGADNNDVVAKMGPLLLQLARVVLATGTLVFIAALADGALDGSTRLIRPMPGEPLSYVALFAQSIYFALATILTVGYGDLRPATGWGQFVAVVTMVVGFAWFTIAFSTIVGGGSRNGDK